MMVVAASLATAVTVAGIISALLKHSRRRRPGSGRMSGLGSDMSPMQFWVVVLGTAGGTFLVVLAVTDLVVVALMPALVVATLPRAYLQRRQARRIAAVREAWPDGLRDLVSSVRSGASLPTALEDLATFGPHALRDAFQGFDLYSRSLGVVPALEMVRDDLADPTADRVIEVLILAYERGGAVVPQILSDLAEATTRDIWTLEQIRTEALEQKINSRVVFVLPWVVLMAMTARSGAFRDFYSTSSGVLVVVVGGILSLLGVAIASRLGALPEEPRVFRGGR